MATSKVTLDRETFKALASETRLDVLHALDERRKTGSELARELNLNKATVHEHLQILEATGLVRKKDEGRKWIYWELTWPGVKLLHPDQGATFSILLGISTLAAGGSIFGLGQALGWWLGGDSQPDVAGLDDTSAAPEELQEESADKSDDPSSDPGTSQDTTGDTTAEEEMLAAADQDAGAADGGFFDDGGWLFLTLMLVAIVTFALAGWLRRRR